MQTEPHCQKKTGNSTAVNNQSNTEPWSNRRNNSYDHTAEAHDVTVSSTMIKVTYNKGIKDHSVTSRENELKNKRHSIEYDLSSSQNYNVKASKIDKNHRKSFNDIPYIPSHISVKSVNGVPAKKRLSYSLKQKDFEVLSEEKNLGNTVNGNLKNHCHNNIEKLNQLKTLQIPLKNLNIVKCQTSESPMSVNHIRDGGQSETDTSANGSDSSQFNKNNNVKNMNEKINVDDGNMIKKQMKKDNGNIDVNSNGKERLKSVKNKDDNLKREKSSSQENEQPIKKSKSDTDISGKQGEKAVKKVKEKKLNVNQNTSTPDKVINSILDRSIDSIDRRRMLLLHDDPTLPSGWRRVIKGKIFGDEFKPLVCIISPEGRRFYVKARLKEYIEKYHPNFTIDDFYFGLYQKSMARVRSTPTGIKRNEDEKKGSGKILKMRENESALQEENRRNDNSSRKSHDSIGQTNGVKETYHNEKKNLLLVDPDLPPGWIRKVRIRDDVEGPDKIQVFIFSPEGRKFRRKNLLQQYLIKTKSPLSIDNFYFGLYPRRRFSLPNSLQKPKMQGKIRNSTGSMRKSWKKSYEVKNRESLESGGDDKRVSVVLKRVHDRVVYRRRSCGERAYINDPTLPTGWRRFIKVRSTGESAGRMENVFVSPDGKSHRSKGHLENYLLEKGLDLTIDQFNFSISGRRRGKRKKKTEGPEESSPLPVSIPVTPARPCFKKRDSLTLPSDTSFPNINLDHPSVYDESKKSREALMINYVGGLMLNSGLRDARSERRLRVPREEHEKILRKYLETEKQDSENDENEILSWIRKLIHCRSDFGEVDENAATTIASLTKEFLLGLTRHALKVSNNDKNLEYSHLAELVEKSDSLSPLKTLIPKKITFKKFIQLNRQTSFV